MRPDIEHKAKDIKVSEDKQKLRTQLQSALADLTAEQKTQKSKKACRNLVSTPQFQEASTIMTYLSLPSETDISEAMLIAWQLGKKVLVPRVDWKRKCMIAVQINSLEPENFTEVGGLRNPINEIEVPFEQIDLIVTPGIGFDAKGNRLGRGASYYDRFFGNDRLRAKRCGFAFQEQLVNSVPVAGHDKPMDFVVTDEQVLYIKTD